MYTVGDLEISDLVDPHVAMAWVAVRNIEREIELGLKKPAREYRTVSGGKIDSISIAVAAAKRRGVEFNVVPGRPLRVKICWCGTFFTTQRVRQVICERCRRLSSQDLCPGYGSPCPLGAVPNKRQSFTATRLKARKGRPWMCMLCNNKRIGDTQSNATKDAQRSMARNRLMSMSKEQRSDMGKKAASRRTTESRSSGALAMHMKMTKEKKQERGDRISSAYRSMTDEAKRERASRISANVDPAKRSEATSQMFARMTKEERSDRMRKAWATRKNRQIH